MTSYVRNHEAVIYRAEANALDNKTSSSTGGCGNRIRFSEMLSRPTTSRSYWVSKVASGVLTQRAIGENHGLALHRLGASVLEHGSSV